MSYMHVGEAVAHLIDAEYNAGHVEALRSIVAGYKGLTQNTEDILVSVGAKADQNEAALKEAVNELAAALLEIPGDSTMCRMLDGRIELLRQRGREAGKYKAFGTFAETNGHLLTAPRQLAILVETSARHDELMQALAGVTRSLFLLAVVSEED